MPFLPRIILILIVALVLIRVYQYFLRKKAYYNQSDDIKKDSTSKSFNNKDVKDAEFEEIE